MYTENGRKTIFDDVKPKKIEKAIIPEDEFIKPTKLFSINKDKFDSSLIVNEYKMPSFKYVDDNSLNDFFDFPDISLSNNPIYKYKYPKLSTGETIKQEWQSQVGTPNELNRFRRQDETGKSLDVIKEEDNVYASGLKQIQDMIDEDTKQLKNDYNDHLKIIKSSNETDQEKEARIKTLNEEKENIETQKKSKNEKTLNKYRKRNPVFIKPVIQKSEEEIEKSKEEFIKRSEARLKELEDKKQKNKELNERRKINLENLKLYKQANKIQSIVRQKLAKKLVENKRNSIDSNKRNSIDSNKRNSIDSNDTKTEIPDMVPQHETYKTNFKSFKSLMEAYKDLPDNKTMEDMSPEDQVKIKGFMKKIGIPAKTKKMQSLRKKLKT